MVHGELMKMGAVKPLSYGQLRSIEKIDAKKARDEKALDVARETVTQIGNLGSSAFTALASFATGPGGYILGLAAIHFLEKVVTVKHQLEPALPAAYWILTSKGNIVAGPYTSYQEANDAYLTGPFRQVHNLTGETFVVKSLGAKPAQYVDAPLLSTDEAELGKSLLTAAATSGVAGNLLGGLFGRR